MNWIILLVTALFIGTINGHVLVKDSGTPAKSSSSESFEEEFQSTTPPNAENDVEGTDKAVKGYTKGKTAEETTVSGIDEITEINDNSAPDDYDMTTVVGSTFAGVEDNDADEHHEPSTSIPAIASTIIIFPSSSTDKNLEEYTDVVTATPCQRTCSFPSSFHLHWICFLWIIVIILSYILIKKVLWICRQLFPSHTKNNISETDGSFEGNFDEDASEANFRRVICLSRRHRMDAYIRAFEASSGGRTVLNIVVPRHAPPATVTPPPRAETPPPKYAEVMPSNDNDNTNVDEPAMLTV